MSLWQTFDIIVTFGKNHIALRHPRISIWVWIHIIARHGLLLLNPNHYRYIEYRFGGLSLDKFDMCLTPNTNRMHLL